MDREYINPVETVDISVVKQATGLYNKEDAGRIIREHIEKENAKKAALFIVSIENPEVAKENLSEAYWEEVLKSTGKNIRMVFRADDIVAQIDKNRFVIFMHNCADEATITRKSELICKYVRSLYIGEGNALSAYVGVVVTDGTDTQYESLLAKAESARERVQSSGREGYMLFVDKAGRKLQRASYHSSGQSRTDVEVENEIGTDDMNRKLMDKLREQVSTTDTLTGMYLYDVFLKKLKDDLDLRDKQIAIIYADIKNFRYVNDNFGYTVGDKLLRIFCEAAKTRLKGFMYASRIFSDNIVVTYSMQEDKSVEENLEEIKEAITDISSIMQSKFLNRKVTVCGGVYVCDGSLENAEIAVSNANLARKEAKRQNDTTMVVFRSSMKDDYNYKMNLASSLPSALENKEFKVYYQPKVESGTGKVVGGEALVRWQKSDGKFIFPNEFIPFFEESGLIVDVDYYVYEAVFADIRSRLDRGLTVVPISMNISRVHLESDDLIHFIRSLFTKYRVPAEYVEFEITESVYMQTYNKAVSLVDSLKGLGAKISMDDFGSGYSSLNMLNNLPIDVLKIDRVFLGNDMDNLSDSQKIIIKSVIEMATRLSLRTVCEGVESKIQTEYLVSIGCDMIQGYYYHKPVPMEEFYEYLEEHEKTGYKTIRFSMDGDLKSDDGRFEGQYIGKNLKYADGPFFGTRAVEFPGGDTAQEVIALPGSVYCSPSYTISCWARIDEANMWASIEWTEFEGGFNSMIPFGGDMRSDFRIWNENMNPQYKDTGSQISIDDKWHFYAAVYNAFTGMSTLYVDNMVAGVASGVPILKNPQRVLIGGDIYKKSLKGAMAEFKIYNQPLSKTDIMEIYERDRAKLRREEAGK